MGLLQKGGLVKEDLGLIEVLDRSALRRAVKRNRIDHAGGSDQQGKDKGKKVKEDGSIEVSTPWLCPGLSS